MESMRRRLFLIFLPILLLIGFLLAIIIAILFFTFSEQPIKTYTVAENTVLSSPLKQNLYSDNLNYNVGVEKPAVTIVEFSDFSCPYCRQSAEKIKFLVLKYSNKVKWIYKDYPLTDAGLKAALAGRCFNEQSKFLMFYDKMFSLLDISTFDYYAYAKELGLKTEQFKECLDTKKYLPNIQNDISLGQSLKLTGTPSWIINDTQAQGVLDWDKLEEFIKASK